MTRWITTLAAALVLMTASQSASAQSLEDLRKLYDEGKYQDVIDRGAGETVPSDQQLRVAFLLALSHQRLSHTDDAKRQYERLASRPESDPWRDVGRSALALTASNAGEAVEAANQAAGKGESLPEAHFQRGLALNMQQDMAGAASAFDKASQLDPAWAYAHYYAGLAFSKARRLDLTASHFDTFLKLAPQAPERPEVLSIMKTLRGR